jgi:steroid delta-isomerase-like uncharacterized protein
VSNKDAMSRFYDAMNAGNTAIVNELLAEDFVEHEEFPGIPQTREGVRQFFEMSRAAFPDFNMRVLHIVAEDDIVIGHALLEGTHEGEFMGMAPTHRRISVPGCDIVRFRDGKGVEHWGVTDTGMMMQQLSAAPEPAPAA